MTNSKHSITSILLLVFLASGCRTAPIENVALEQYRPKQGYGSVLHPVRDGGKLRVVLAFSGGGTRAAALAYGVMKELRETEILLDGKKTRLIDQVSTISSVSGGSFTSAYYGLYGDRLFEDFEDRFLRKNIQGRLVFSLLRPIDLIRMLFTRYTRTDIAMDLYDREVFDGATFADLAEVDGPTLNINSTDIDVGVVFTFIQPVFNLICSDLSKMRISQAVTASSAVPGAFAPLVLKNHSGTCGMGEPEWIREALAHPRESRRRYHEARSAASYLDPKKRPYIFLVDGGIADNIGARRIIADVISAGGFWKLVKRGDVKMPEYVLYIVVNAQAGGHHRWDTQARVPSLASVLSTISGTGIYRYNFETIELLRESSKKWSAEASQLGVPVQSFVSEVAFDALEDKQEREYFNGVKTSFDLDDQTVDRLIEVGGRLLRESRDFKDFLSKLH